MSHLIGRHFYLSLAVDKQSSRQVQGSDIGQQLVQVLTRYAVPRQVLVLGITNEPADS